MLFVDIQGAEKDMILGGKEILSKTNWIFIESYENEMYEGQVTRAELINLLPDFELVNEFNDSNILLHRRIGKKSPMLFNTRIGNEERQDREIIYSVYTKDEYDLNQLAKTMTPKTILEIGGHIGSFGLKALELWPEARLIVYEPCQESSELYKTNLKLNNLKGEVFTAAVDVDSTKNVLALSKDVHSTGCYTLINPNDNNKKFLPNQKEEDYTIIDTNVTVTTLEQIFIKHNLDFIDLLKLDCEGSERAILENITPEIANKIGTIVCEYHFPIDTFELLIHTKFPNHKIKQLGKDIFCVMYEICI